MRWYRRFFRREMAERQLDAELRFHLDQKIADLVAAGVTPEEARRRAQLEFGGLDQVKEECRDVGGSHIIESLIQDLRYRARMLRKGPGFAAVAAATLALGIGANTAIFSLIDAVMLRMLPVEEPEELMQVQWRDSVRGDEDSRFTNPLWEQFRDRQDVFSTVFASGWGAEEFDLGQGGPVQYANGLYTSGSYFSTLGVRPAVGRLFSVADDRPGCPSLAVLSYGFWQDHFGGDPSAVGKVISLNQRPFRIIGVSAAGFYGIEVGYRFDVAVPLCAAPVVNEHRQLDQRSGRWLRVLGRLKPRVSQKQLNTRLAVLSPQITAGALPDNSNPEERKYLMRQILVSAPVARGITDLRGQFGAPLRFLMAMVGLVLLIACANIAGLMLARAAARTREIAVRQALGASRLRLIRQLLTECVLLSSAGAAIGILFARWGGALLVSYISTWKDAVFLDLSLDGRVLGFTAAIAALTCALFGLLPALRSTRVSLTCAVKGGQAIGNARHERFATHKWIVAAQVAVSLILLVAAGLLMRSFANLATLDIGFDRNNVLLVGVDLRKAKMPPERQFATFEEIERRLGALPGVVSIGRSVITPIFDEGWNQPIQTEWSKGLVGHETDGWFNCVSPGFFQTLRMPLLAGRDFNTGDTRNSPPVVVVNQTLARRFFPGLNPIGKIFRVENFGGKPGPPIEVVGLVRDAKYWSVREDTFATAFLPATQVPGMFQAETYELRIAVPPSALVRLIQAAVAGVNNEIPIKFHTLVEQVSDSLVQERLLAAVSAFFGGLALLLATVGLYGALSYMVTQRQAEFGIRMALGAEAGCILRLVMRDVAVILAGGIVAGALISLATTRVLATLLFGLSARDPMTLAGAVIVLSAVVCLAGFIPARRATKVDPIVALRYE